MAYLTAENSNNKIYLKPFHRLGRLPDAVDTVVESREVSRIHAIIEWIDNHWTIRDVSKNGIWVNNEKIKSNESCILTLKDKICFAIKDNINFIVDSVERPRDVLVPYCHQEVDGCPTKDPIFLEQYHFLPSETSPELIVFYDTVEKAWFSEQVSKYTVNRIADGELVEFSDSVWQLIKVADVFQLETIDISDKTDNEMTFVFSLSQDEESTELRLEGDTQLIDFDIRSHHYLSALLARYRSNDAIKMIDQHLQGWVPIDKLTRDLGLSESHLNIQIHRARKQLADKLKALGLSGPMLIERKKGQVRFGSSNFKIFKGKALEVDGLAAS
ncbi:MAG: FHA domain-containing protein [Algicola sp.]|nr:FHA domain-containing protein [Algicola sp.]